MQTARCSQPFGNSDSRYCVRRHGSILLVLLLCLTIPGMQANECRKNSMSHKRRQLSSDNNTSSVVASPSRDITATFQAALESTANALALLHFALQDRISVSPSHVLKQINLTNASAALNKDTVEPSPSPTSRSKTSHQSAPPWQARSPALAHISTNMESATALPPVEPEVMLSGSSGMQYQALLDGDVADPGTSSPAAMPSPKTRGNAASSPVSPEAVGVVISTDTTTITPSPDASPSPEFDGFFRQWWTSQSSPSPSTPPETTKLPVPATPAPMPPPRLNPLIALQKQQAQFANDVPQVPIDPVATAFLQQQQQQQQQVAGMATPTTVTYVPAGALPTTVGSGGISISTSTPVSISNPVDFQQGTRSFSLGGLLKDFADRPRVVVVPLLVGR